MILYENELFDLSLSNSILYLEYRPNTTVDLSTAKITVAKRMQVQESKVYPLFFDMRGAVDSDKAGRDYLANYGFLFTSAVAIMVNHGISLSITSFYLKRYRSDIPLKIFTYKPKALEYLSTIR